MAGPSAGSAGTRGGVAWKGAEMAVAAARVVPAVHSAALEEEPAGRALSVVAAEEAARMV